MTGGAVGDEAFHFLSRFENPIVEKPIDFGQLRRLITDGAPA
jgi:hypothetical protein